MKIGILTFELFHGKKDIGSSRIRGEWLIKNWPEAELFKLGEKYDCVIYQKAYFPIHARAFKGIKILDLCDPDWFMWNSNIVEMILEVDAITCSTEALASAVREFTDKPVYFIPDRVYLDSIIEPKKSNDGFAKKVVWYGYSQNFAMVDSLLPAIVKRNLELIVVSNQAYAPTAQMKDKIVLSNLPWSQHWMSDIQRGDIVLNPQYNKGKWKYKSDNKTKIARCLGVPVAHTEDELDQYMSDAARKSFDELVPGYREEYDVKKSVLQYKDVIASIQVEKARTSGEGDSATNH